MRIRPFLATLSLVFLGACYAVYEEPRWVGLSEGDIVAELGDPSDESMVEVTADARLYEYQSGLYDHLPPGDGQATVFRQLRWERPTRTEYAWLRVEDEDRWVVVETLIADDGVLF